MTLAIARRAGAIDSARAAHRGRAPPDGRGLRAARGRPPARIAANLRFPFLDRFLDRALRARPALPGARPAPVQLLILALFDDAGRGHPTWPRCATNLGARDGPGQVRRVQLAGELAELFLAYTMSRRT